MPRLNGWRHDERRTLNEAHEQTDEDETVATVNRWFREEPRPVEVLLQHIPETDSPKDYRVRVNGDDSVPDLEATTRTDARSNAFDYMDNTPKSKHADGMTEAEYEAELERAAEAELEPREVDVDEAAVDLESAIAADDPDADESTADADDASTSTETDTDDESESDADPEQCHATTGSGDRCSNPAAPGSDFCHIDAHGPDDSDAESETETDGVPA